jgi:hypothetical protein
MPAVLAFAYRTAGPPAPISGPSQGPQGDAYGVGLLSSTVRTSERTSDPSDRGRVPSRCSFYGALHLGHELAHTEAEFCVQRERTIVKSCLEKSDSNELSLGRSIQHRLHQ